MVQPDQRHHIRLRIEFDPVVRTPVEVNGDGGNHKGLFAGDGDGQDFSLPFYDGAAREREGAVQPGVKEPAAVLFDVQLAVCLDCGDRVPLYFESGGIGVRRGEAEGLSIADGQGDEGRPVAHDKVSLSRFDPVRLGLV